MVIGGIISGSWEGVRNRKWGDGVRDGGSARRESGRGRDQVGSGGIRI